MNLLIIGTGYVGLVTGACFAEMGHTVICLDVDAKKIANLNQGILPIYEVGLEEIVRRNAASKRLTFTTNYSEAISKSDICFIAVPTPSQEDGSCDLSYVLAAAEEIARHLTKPMTVVIKSTVPVGTSKQVASAMRCWTTFPISMVSNPEFLKEGTAVSDCLKPDRIILGVDDDKTAQLMRELYSSFTARRDRILTMDIPSAEMTKYAANAMLATRISFMNELSGLCEKVGANINDVRIGIGSDERIGSHFLYAGIGFGGSCFPKDITALEAMGSKVHYDMPILHAVKTVNSRQKKVLGKKIENYFEAQGGIEGKIIAIWGLAFKPDTDDTREAPALELIEELLQRGATVKVFDPVAKLPSHLASKVTFSASEYDAAENSHAIALVTEWKQFRFVKLDEILAKMQGKAFFDGRNQYKKQEMLRKGFDYFGIGIPK